MSTTGTAWAGPTVSPSPAYTQRQAQQLRSNGARYSYTPQVVVDGRDQPDWRALPLPLASSDARASAPCRLTLAARRRRPTAREVRALAGAPERLAAYWALTEDGHVSAVKAGENRGARLTNDFVVREYEPIAAGRPRPSRARAAVQAVTLATSSTRATSTGAGRRRHMAGRCRH